MALLDVRESHVAQQVFAQPPAGDIGVQQELLLDVIAHALAQPIAALRQILREAAIRRAAALPRSREISCCSSLRPIASMMRRVYTPFCVNTSISCDVHLLRPAVADRHRDLDGVAARSAVGRARTAARTSRRCRATRASSSLYRPTPCFCRRRLRRLAAGALIAAPSPPAAFGIVAAWSCRLSACVGIVARGLRRGGGSSLDRSRTRRTDRSTCRTLLSRPASSAAPAPGCPSAARSR